MNIVFGHLRAAGLCCAMMLLTPATSDACWLRDWLFGPSCDACPPPANYYAPPAANPCYGAVPATTYCVPQTCQYGAAPMTAYAASSGFDQASSLAATTVPPQAAWNVSPYGTLNQQPGYAAAGLAPSTPAYAPQAPDSIQHVNWQFTTPSGSQGYYPQAQQAGGYPGTPPAYYPQRNGYSPSY